MWTCPRLNDEQLEYFYNYGFYKEYDHWELIQAEGGISIMDIVCWLQYQKNIYIRVTSVFNHITGIYREFSAEILTGEYNQFSHNYMPMYLNNDSLPVTRNELECYIGAINYIISKDLLNKSVKNS